MVEQFLIDTTDPETALDAATPVIHPDLGDNLTFERTLDVGDVDKAFAQSDAVVETTFLFGRHTGVTNEPRSIVADWNTGDQRLTYPSPNRRRKSCHRKTEAPSFRA